MIRRFTSTHWPLTWHTHPELELTLIDEGVGLRYVGDGVERFSAGDLVMIGGNLPHAWTSDPQPDHRFSSLVLQFPPELFAQDWIKATEARQLRGLIEQAAYGIQLQGIIADEVRALMRSMEPLRPGLRRIGLLVAILGIVVEAGTGLRRLSRTPCMHTESVQRDPWLQLVTWLHAHAHEPISQAFLARRMSCTPGSFAHAFRRRFGTTVMDYIASIRLARVARDLVATTASVTEIAQRAGFNNLSSFNQRFRRVMGMTPRQYRQHQFDTDTTGVRADLVCGSLKKMD